MAADRLDRMTTVESGTMPHLSIKDFQPNTYVNGVYALVNPQMGTTRAGKPFFKALIRDATGEAAIRVWTFEEASMPEVTRTGFVFVSGQTQAYNGQVQMIAETIRSVDVEEKDLARLLPVTKGSIDGMMAEVAALLRSMRHPGMLALAEQYLATATLMDRFRSAPAAVSVHHAYIGGLLEHTLQLMKLADVMLPLYPGLNRDLVLMGLFLHDLGKTRELVYDRAFSYSDRGELIGHIVEGALMLQEKVHVLMRDHGVRLPNGTLTVLQHIILSHHGVPEYGAAKIPATPEAILVSMLDNLDAKTTMSLAAARPDRVASFDAGGNFTEKQWALDTKLFKPDVLKAK